MNRRFSVQYLGTTSQKNQQIRKTTCTEQNPAASEQPKEQQQQRNATGGIKSSVTCLVFL